MDAIIANANDDDDFKIGLAINPTGGRKKRKKNENEHHAI